MTRRFRWAELQIEELETKNNEVDLRKALTSVPRSLEGTYHKVLDHIPPSDMSMARGILIMICLSPVTLDGNTVAAMVNIFPEDVVPICTSSLVHLNNDKIQLAHFSVQEFLLVSERRSQHHECQFSVTAGRNYLAQIDYLLTQTRVLANEEEALGQPFLAYAAKYWYTHVAALGGIDQLDPDFQAKVHRLFTEFNVYSNWIRVVRSIDWSEYPQWRWIQIAPKLRVATSSSLKDGVTPNRGRLAKLGRGY